MRVSYSKRPEPNEPFLAGFALTQSFVQSHRQTELSLGRLAWERALPMPWLWCRRIAGANSIKCRNTI